MMEMIDILNGAQLPRFINKPVSIIGKVKNVDPNGRFFYIDSTDNVQVRINVKQPINSPLSGWVEVRGLCDGKTINAEDFVIFSNEEYDYKAYNELCTLLYTVPSIWNTS